MYPDTVCIKQHPARPGVYGKSILGMQEYIKANALHDARILFLHTGGTPLFYDFLAKEGAGNTRCKFRS